jgi:septum formation protein
MTLPKILLASKSPRRKELLENAGFEVTVVYADVEEDYPESLATEDIAVFLANKKAAPFIGAMDDNTILITADSIVVLDGIVYGKPTSKTDGANTLKNLSGNIHKVYTGVCLYNGKRTASFTEESEIKFDTLTDEEIDYYLEKYQPYDKAGSYGIQDWIGLCKVEWIKGTFSNIMGLPIAKVYKEIIDLQGN